MKLHQAMKTVVEKRPDIAFYLKVFVLVSPNPRVAKSIVCARSISMLEDAYEKKEVPNQECASTDLDDNLKYAQSNGLNAAPALVFPDGTVQMGYLEADKLEKRIDEAARDRKKEVQPAVAK